MISLHSCRNIDVDSFEKFGALYAIERKHENSRTSLVESS